MPKHGSIIPYVHGNQKANPWLQTWTYIYTYRSMALDACQQHTRPPTFPVAELNHAGFDKLRAKVFLP